MIVDKDKFGSRLRTMLKDRKLSQKAFSDMTGISRCAINRWIHGIAFPSGECMVIMAKALNVTMDDLLKDIVKE